MIVGPLSVQHRRGYFSLIFVVMLGEPIFFQLARIPRNLCQPVLAHCWCDIYICYLGCEI